MEVILDGSLANFNKFGVVELREDDLRKIDGGGNGKLLEFVVTYVVSKVIDAVIENPKDVVEGAKKALEQEAKLKPITVFFMGFNL